MEIMTAQHAETHGETMIVIRLNVLPGSERLRCDLQRILRLDHLLAKPRKLARHAGNPIRFLLPGVGDASDAGSTFEERSNGCERQERVGNWFEITVEATARVRRFE